MRKITPYNILKGLRYLKHFGPKQFMVRLRERMEPEEVPYGPWYEQYRPTEQELSRQRTVKWEKDHPVFSIVVPVYRTPEKLLREMIASVQGQTYPYFELCIVNASPEDAKLTGILGAYQAEDERIRVLPLSSNAGIAENTNAGIRMAGGEWIAFLDHDDLLSPAALYFMACFLKDHPDTGVLYTDEDKIRDTGGKQVPADADAEKPGRSMPDPAAAYEHFQPNLKPDYNPDLLRSNNYICHFVAVRRELALSCGGLRQAFDGAQDHDFLFRVIKEAQDHGLMVGHVPEILYHWRTHAASTADNPMSKLYAYEAGKRAIEEELGRRGTVGEVSLKKDLGFYRVVYPVSGEPLISIVIPNKDQADTLDQCLTSIRTRSTYRNYEIIVVENHSQEEQTFEYYRRIDGKDGVRVVTWDELPYFNYSSINNFGEKCAKGEYILCLNNDVEVITPGWMEELLGVAQRPEVAAVGARLYYPDDTIQHAGIVIGIGGIAGSMFVDMKRSYSGYLHKAELMQDMSAVTAACMLVKRSVWEELGGFEEKLSVAFNDVDLCLRMREKDDLVVYDPYVEMYHHESRSRGAEDTKQKVRRFQGEIEYIRTRWTQLLIDGDPCYNKNLSLSKWNYSLRPGAHMGQKQGV